MEARIPSLWTSWHREIESDCRHCEYMQFDVYDLELTKVYDNAELKWLLVQTTAKSLIVVEDIDCSLKLPNRDGTDEDPNGGTDHPSDHPSSNKLTLSGLLNFVDGLWSCCEEERIFIFTTNFKEQIDPALLRAGRMDMHILLSYCTFHAFKKLANNYLGVQDHPKFVELQEAMVKSSVQVTPAAIAEILIRNQDNPDVALSEVLTAFSTYVDIVDDENIPAKHVDVTNGEPSSLGKIPIHQLGPMPKPIRFAMPFLHTKDVLKNGRTLCTSFSPLRAPRYGQVLRASSSWTMPSTRNRLFSTRRALTRLSVVHQPFRA
ncbi:hypothetical protein KP509_19G070700 [Ceratopteris richardii]|uniref:ATPase AAA-type core domain-containing protein n=1 Tax=Ceratopteris richardii TaxID=49495 RepID=A0A8T2SN28_CERRI|nr:hypothetical protein KP509_19G070700 [Ceratopteris richardii]